MIQENPAAKLYSLLENAQRMGNTRCRTVWANTFDIDESDTSALLSKYNSLLELYFSTKKLIKENARLDNDKNNSYINAIGQALGLFSLSGNTGQFSSLLTPEVMLALHYISENISLVYDLPDSVANEDEMKEILADIETLISNITDSQLPPDVKQILVKNLFMIKESLHSYFITGIEGVKESLERTIGSVIMNGPVLAPEAGNENVKSFYKVMIKLNEIISTINGAKELVAPLAKIFLND
ncbi:hypothetical protein [Priestia megaterium]|uniref:hypothetical protein n=1 Tax=Priestia megaterium TaxID=1404 RepID=UPI0011AA6FEA|nr:hypothetical protein [Priestia megaterium]